MDKYIQAEQREDKQPIIETFKLPKAKSWQVVPKEFLVVFLMKGSLEFSYGKVSLILNKGYAWIIPSGMELWVHSLEATQLIIVRMHMDGLYEGLPLKMDYYKDVDLSCISRDSDLLEIKPVLWPYLSSLSRYINAGLTSPAFLELKRRELGYLFDTYYSRGELLWFLRSLITDDTIFAAKVMSNYYKIKNVAELAAICGYSLSGFEKHFAKVFHVSPGKWMKQQKAKAIYHELKYGKQPVKAIGLDYGFCTPSHFTNYCKKHFGMTPCELRKRM